MALALVSGIYLVPLASINSTLRVPSLAGNNLSEFKLFQHFQINQLNEFKIWIILTGTNFGKLLKFTKIY